MYGSSPNLLQFVEALVEVLHRMVLSMRLGTPGDQVLEQDLVGCGNPETLPHVSPAVSTRHPLEAHDKASAAVRHSRMEEEELMDVIRGPPQCRNLTYQQ